MKRIRIPQAWVFAGGLSLLGLVACGGGGSGSSTPAGPSITSFTANPKVIASGGTAALTGVFANGNGSVSDSADSTLVSMTSGTAINVSPTTTTTYTLTVLPATGTAVTKTATVTIDPNPATITSFVASPTTIISGGTATLTGVFTNGAGVVTPGNNTVSSGTALTVTPTTTTTYTLTVTDALGMVVTKTATVTVTAAPSAITFSTTAPTTATVGTPYTYTPAASETGATVTISATSTLPSGATFTGGILNWTPKLPQAWQAISFTLQASDGKGNTTNQTWSVTPAGSTGQSIVGTWLPENISWTEVDSELPDGTYLHGVYAPNYPGDPDVGIDVCSYTYTQSTGLVTFYPDSINTNGDWGNTTTNSGVVESISSTNVTFKFNGQSPSTSSRLLTNTDPLMGTWVDYGADFNGKVSGEITFLPGGYVMFIILDGPTTSGGLQGIDYGTYTFNKNSGMLSCTIIASTTGNWGAPLGNSTWNLTFSGNGNIIVINGDNANSTFTRLEP